jgi:hypothetical protein
VATRASLRHCSASWIESSLAGRASERGSVMDEV